MTKRANGEGSVYQRKDGLWAGDLSYRLPDGTAKRRTVYGKSQREALAKLKDARKRLDAGAPVKDAKTTSAPTSSTGSRPRSQRRTGRRPRRSCTPGSPART